MSIRSLYVEWREIRREAPRVVGLHCGDRNVWIGMTCEYKCVILEASADRRENCCSPRCQLVTRRQSGSGSVSWPCTFERERYLGSQWLLVSFGVARTLANRERLLCSSLNESQKAAVRADVENQSFLTNRARPGRGKNSTVCTSCRQRHWFWYHVPLNLQNRCCAVF